jgi:gas vesicle protein
MNSFFRIATGALVGAATSATLVILLTPQSGPDLRQALRDRIGEVRAAGQEAAETRRLELTEEFEALKRPQGQS